MKPLSVAFIRQRYASDGGAERFVSRTLQALRSQNVSLTLMTRAWKDRGAFDVVECDPFYVGRVWRDWSFAQSVCRELEKRSFDLVQSHERLTCCDVYRAGDGVHREWLKQLARVRSPLNRLGLALNPYHWYVRSTEAKLFASPRLRAVICNSKMVRAEIKHNFGVSDHRLHVIYSGVDTQAYHPDLRRHRADIRQRYAIADTDTLYLFVGSGFERKGVSALLAAFKQIPDNAFLIIVGHDKHLGRYQRMAEASGVARQTVFVGAQANVKPFYGAADVMVLPSLYDPFPNVALEAMASGLPLITSHQSGAAELIENGKNGFTCDALDTIALSEFMRSLLDAQVREQLGRAARQTVESLTLSRMSDQLVQLYQQLLASP